MKRYYANIKKQSYGGHEIHCEDCNFLPKIDKRIYLGQFNSCIDAMTIAKKYYTKLTGCKHCSEVHHIS